MATDASSLSDLGDIRERVSDGHMNVEFTKEEPVASSNILLINKAGFGDLTKGSWGFAGSTGGVQSCGSDSSDGPPAHQALIQGFAIDDGSLLLYWSGNIDFVGESIKLCHGLSEVSIYGGMNSGSYLPFA